MLGVWRCVLSLFDILFMRLGRGVPSVGCWLMLPRGLLCFVFRSGSSWIHLCLGYS